MLAELILENFILMERAAFAFDSGFTVITGATGAGKSLLVKALKLLLGARADTSVVRPGAEYATIQALFEISADLEKALGDLGLEIQGELVIRRVIHSKGKSRVYLNGNLTTLQQLRDVATRLLNIASQHEFQNLLKKERQLEMLDDFGNLHRDRIKLARLYNDAARLRKKAQELQKQYDQREDEIERIKWQIKLIDDVDPKEDEEHKLEKERSLLRSSSKLRELGDEIYQRLYGAQGSVTEELSNCRISMSKMVELDPGLEPLRELLEAISFQADDIAMSIRDYLHALPSDIVKLDSIEERLFKLQGLKKRFGPEISDVLAHRQALEKELDRYQHLEHEMEHVFERLKKADEKLCKAAKELSTKRKRLCKAMEEAVAQELSSLDLQRARFKVRLTCPLEISAESVSRRGADQVEFAFSANPGQPLRPLALVASGGELSRILLALKSIGGKQEIEETLVFDEIDTGLGGEVAENVGRKLKKMGKTHQVIAITHFPQIAAMGERHLVVEKQDRHGATISEIRELSPKERLDEIVRMLGGETETAKRYANELLDTVLRRT